MKVVIEIFKITGKWDRTEEYISALSVYEGGLIEMEIRRKFKIIENPFTFKAKNAIGVNFRLCV